MSFYFKKNDFEYINKKVVKGIPMILSKLYRFKNFFLRIKQKNNTYKII